MAWDTYKQFRPFIPSASVGKGQVGKMAGLGILSGAVKAQAQNPWDPSTLMATMAANDAQKYSALIKADADLEIARNRQASIEKYIQAQEEQQAQETNTNNWISGGIAALKLGAAFIPGAAPVAAALNLIG